MGIFSLRLGAGHPSRVQLHKIALSANDEQGERGCSGPCCPWAAATIPEASGEAVSLSFSFPSLLCWCWEASELGLILGSKCLSAWTHQPRAKEPHEKQCPILEGGKKDGRG